MKKIVSLLAVFAIVLTACTGDQGPAGPPGLPGSDGNDGGIIVSSAFEIKNINFNVGNNFSHSEDYGFEVLEFDMPLVYIKWQTHEGIDFWRLLPQNVFFDDGTLIYNFDFTKTDFSIFLDGTKDLASLGAEWTQNQVFRVVIIPADNIGSVDISNLKDVMQNYNIQNFEIK